MITLRPLDLIHVDEDVRYWPRQAIERAVNERIFDNKITLLWIPVREKIRSQVWEYCYVMFRWIKHY